MTSKTNQRCPSEIEVLSKEASELFRKEQEIYKQTQEQTRPLRLHFQELKQKIKDEQDKAVLNNIEVLLSFNPEHHGMPECTDETLSRYGKCTRCTLLYLKKNEWEIENFRFQVVVDPEYVKGDE